MKKRNWTLLCLAAGAVTFGAFGAWHALAKDNGTFLLEDVSGDRAYLSAFPLEGYGGNHVNSVEFTIIDGELDVTHHSYDRNTLKNIRTGRETGQSEWMSYFSYAWDSDGSDGDTLARPAPGAKLEYSPTPGIGLFEEYTEHYRVGETITADQIEIYGEVRAFFDDENSIARYPTGLTITEPTVFTYSATQKNGGTTAYMNSYEYGYIGEAYGIRKLESFSTELGKTIFAVTVPDARCAGETYIYRVTPEEKPYHRLYKDVPLQEYITREQDPIGTAEPFLPVPDPAERRIVGLEGLGEEYLAVFLLEGDDFIAEIYDMDANFIGSARQTLTSTRDPYPEFRVVKEYQQAHEIDVYFVPYEEGCSLSIRVSDRVVLEEEKEDYGDDVHTGVTGRMLLWITADGVELVGSDYDTTIAAVRGDYVLLLDHARAPEKDKIVDVVGTFMEETYEITILDAASRNVLYKGRLKNDYWQDALDGLARVDNGGANAYVENSGVGWRQDGRSIEELKPIGGRSGDIW